MKINKYISIDEDIFRRLTRENNASDLINQLLLSHYNQKNCQNLEILKQKYAEIKQILKENKRKEKELRLKIDQLDQKNKKFFENFKQSYPPELINKLKKIKNLDYEAAIELARSFDLIRRGIGGIKLIEIWEKVRKNVMGQQ